LLAAVSKQALHAVADNVAKKRTTTVSYIWLIKHMQISFEQSPSPFIIKISPKPDARFTGLREVKDCSTNNSDNTSDDDAPADATAEQPQQQQQQPPEYAAASDAVVTAAHMLLFYNLTVLL